MGTDDVAAILAGWREAELNATAAPWEVHRSSSAGIRLASDESDWPLAEGFRRAADAEFAAVARTAVPRLVATAEAVLKLADSARVRQQVYLPGSVTQPISWDLDPAKIREAIAAALTGEEAGDEPQVP